MLSIATLGNAIGWVAIVGLIGAGVTIGIGIVQTIKWIEEAIKTKEEKLADLKKDLEKANKKRGDNADKDEELDRLIGMYNRLRGQAQAKLDEAIPEYEAAKTAYDTAKENYDKYSKEYSQLLRLYMDHTGACYYCDANNRCYEGTSLEQRMSRAWKSSRKWKVKHGNAKSTLRSKMSEKYKWTYYVRKYTRKRDDYQEDKDELAESHVTLLKKIKTLKKDIPVKEKEIEAAKVDLNTVKAAKNEYPGYLKRLEKADEQGKNMRQWIINNPPPGNFEEYLEKYHE